MDALNYQHLLYFWRVAREGSLARASSELRLAQSTVSKQIHQLEGALGQALFAKSGRRLVLTESGRVVFRYADEIFGLGRELLDTLADRPAGKPLRVTIGIADSVPKPIAEQLLAPALELDEPVRLVCREGEPGRLLAELALHELDAVISDAPAGPEVKVRVFHHRLGSSGISFFATPDLARRARGAFPASLGELPLLLPAEHTALRRRLDPWFESLGIRPTVAAEFEDAALLDVFGVRGVGAFPAATVAARDLVRRHGVRPLGRAGELRVSYWAITVERRIRNPAVVAISERARTVLDGTSGRARRPA